MIAKKIAAQLKLISGVELIILHGSAAAGMADEYSDADILIYCSKRIASEHFCKKLGIPLIEKRVPFTLAFEREGFPVSIGVESVSLYRDYPSENTHLNPFRDNELQKQIVSFILNTVVLYDKRNRFKRFRNLRELPENFKQHILAFELGRLELNFAPEHQDAHRKRKNIIGIVRSFDRANLQIARVIYALNGKFLLNEKLIPREIASFRIKPNNCIKRMEQMMLLSAKDPQKLALYRKFIGELQVLARRENTQV